MKLNNFSLDNWLVITQAKHGAAQGNMAFDIGLLGGSAPANGVVTKIYTHTTSPKPYPARLSFFDFGKDNWILQMVHAKPKYKVGVAVPDRAALWDSTWHHLHVGIKVNSNWGVVFDYMRRDIELYWLKKGQKHPTWTNWSTYTDRQLQPYTNIPDNGKLFEMVKLQHPITVRNDTGDYVNIRKAPTSKSEKLGQISPGASWQTQCVAEGESVDGNSTWYQNGAAWVAGRFLTEVPQTTNQDELDALKAQNEVLKKQNEALKKENEEIVAKNVTSNLVYDYTKKIDNLINNPIR
jgi:hypothetical protein